MCGGEGGAYAWDKSTSARPNAKNAGGEAFVQEGWGVGAYLQHTTILELLCS